MPAVMNGCREINNQKTAMIYNRQLIILGLFILVFLLCGGEAFPQTGFRVMFYNTENLFDCKHDTLKNDYEFLPNSMRAWHYGRYKQKLNHISKVITAVGEWNPPVLVGLCEVENDSVLTSLVKYSPLKTQGYRYVMTHSRDERGIDVALLYQRGSFRLIAHDSIRINFPDKNKRPTRDILHVVGQVINGDSLDVFVCHFPSRTGGEKESEPNRIFAASCLKHYTDSLFAVRTHPNILIMGDFNDYPHNKSISEILGAKAPSSVPDNKILYNLLAEREKDKSFGSYKYQGEWNILDQLIVSGFLLNHKDGLSTSEKQAGICNQPFLLEKDEKYSGVKPFRTYYGMKYQGGFSDHLPVFLDFTLSE
jgi:predicted extracellular nuclease